MLCDRPRERPPGKIRKQKGLELHCTADCMALLGFGGNRLHYGTLWHGPWKLLGVAGGSRSHLDSGSRSHEPDSVLLY